MAVEDPTKDMVYAALYQGISPKPLMGKLARKQSSSLQGLMDQEETLKAMASSRPSRDRSLARKKKDSRKAERRRSKVGKEI